jgi:hypothetical protein
VIGGALGRGHRRLVVADAVVEHGGRPLCDGYPVALAAQAYVFDGRVDQGGRLRSSTAECLQTHARVGREAGAGCVHRSLQLLDEGRCFGQLSSEQEYEGTRTKGHRQLAERAHVAGKLDVPVSEQLPAIVFP